MRVQTLSSSHSSPVVPDQAVDERTVSQALQALSAARAPSPRHSSSMMHTAQEPPQASSPQKPGSQPALQPSRDQ